MTARRRTPKPDHWRKRRAFMLVTVGFCMGVIVYVLWRNIDSESAQTAVSMAFVIIGTTVASYVFGAAWEDVQNVRVNAEYGLPGDDELVTDDDDPKD